MPPMDFSEMFPHAERSALDLLTRMLAFSEWEGMIWYSDPAKRITVREALESEFVSVVRRPEQEVGMKDRGNIKRLTTKTMVFPFEYGIQGGPENERQILRRLIYNEALLFRWVVRDTFEIRQERAANEASSPLQSRHRSLTMGSVPHGNLMPYNSPFNNKNCGYWTCW